MKTFSLKAVSAHSFSSAINKTPCRKEIFSYRTTNIPLSQNDLSILAVNDPVTDTINGDIILYN